MKKKYLNLIVVVAIIGFICIAIGVTYAVFNYYKKGKIENVITSGKITFRYDENSVNGINLTSAVPMTDRKGASLEGEENVFDFTVSTGGTDATLYYDIELALTENSDLDPSIVKIYLAEVVDGVEVPEYAVINNGVIKTYTELTDNSDSSAKGIGSGNFQISKDSQEKNYRLKIWIDKEADFSPLTNEDGTYQEDENGNYIYPYNGKKFEVRVNVKAGAVVDGSFEGLGDAGIGIGCHDEYGFCTSMTPVTLPDGSNWKLLTRYNNGDDTINLIYDDYVDSNGDYSTSEVLVASYYIDDILNNFANRIKTSLNDENIIVSLPKVSQVNDLDWFDVDYDDDYFISDMEEYIVFGNYFFEDISYISLNWKLENYHLTYFINNYNANSSVKPVITVSSDYLTQNYDYKVGDAVTATDGSKWHVIENSLASSDTVTLLSDYNLNSDGTYNTTCGRDINGQYECSGMAFDEDLTNVYDETDSNNIGYFIKNVYEPLVTAALSGTTNVTIPTSIPHSTTNTWLYTTNYWLNDPYIDLEGYGRAIDGANPTVSGDIAIPTNESYYGARPIITTLKTNLISE